ncbi:MAG: geranyl transferase [Betaproteobacteria bacterium]|nr:geranyl transferase [Betaproteobacteria bacterium]
MSAPRQTNPSDPPFLDWTVQRQASVERALERLIEGCGAQPPRLLDAMRYAALDGGKRIRPLLVYAAGELSEASEPALDLAASAVELIHAYSLVHDDLPCMDNDVLRRGKPTVHVAYGEATAMLVGDGLQSLAFAALAQLVGRSVSAPAVVKMVAELAAAAGAQGMVGGQALDLSAVGQTLDRQSLEAMHRAKTGAMLQASVRLGWLTGPRASDSDATFIPSELDHYANLVGLAFQVIDDVLDVESDTHTLGKTAGKDSEHNKPTFVSLLGLEASRALAIALRDEAVAALSPWGDRSRRLIDLADRIIKRRA